MNVLFTPHIEHYTIGLSRELAKYIDVWILSTSQFNTPAKHILIPDIPKVRGLLKILSLKLLPKIFDVVHTNTSQEGLIVCNLDKLIVTEHGWPDPKFVHKSAQKYYYRERESLLRLYEVEAMGSGLPVIVPRSGGAYEVAGSAALTFNSHDPVDLADKIVAVCNDTDLYKKLSVKSLERSKKLHGRKQQKTT